MRCTSERQMLLQMKWKTAKKEANMVAPEMNIARTVFK